MTSVSVLVPFDTDERWRTRDWWYIQSLLNRSYRHWEICVGKCHTDVWCRPEALIDAYRKSHGDVLVIQEPDSWSFGLPQALQVVVDGEFGWSVGHTKKHRLTQLATDIVLCGYAGDLRIMPTVELPYELVPGNTGMVMPRAVFREVPPDAVFTGWGGEDEAWGMALRELVGREYRSSEPLVHLWHPNEGRDVNGHWETSDATALRFERYKRAVHHPARMRKLVAEAVTVMEDLNCPRK